MDNEAVERVATAIGKVLGLDLSEVCGIANGDGECDSSTCPGALTDDHDAEDSANTLHRMARAAIAAIGRDAEAVDADHIAAHAMTGCFHQPDGHYAAICRCNEHFLGVDYGAAIKAWALHVAPPAADQSGAELEICASCDGSGSGAADTVCGSCNGSGGTAIKDDADEAYEIGKRDGYSEALADVDRRTGGDGEYFASTIPGRGCPDEAAMMAKIVGRFDQSPEVARLREALENIVLIDQHETIDGKPYDGSCADFARAALSEGNGDDR